jgi:hypothetical protein
MRQSARQRQPDVAWTTTMAVEHPQWQCPRCKTVMFWLGATTHKRHCDGEEPWREALRRTRGG